MAKKHKGHKKHLCVLVAADGIKNIEGLIAEGKYFCKNCGRVANKKKNLCKPKKLAAA
jgi:hypothetical protein